MSFSISFPVTGNPAEVLQLVDSPLPTLADHEVRVRMHYAPVNPADLNFIEGNYGRASNPPAVPGHEGCGEVEAIGPQVTTLAIGDVVIPLLGVGCWSQHLTAAETHFIKLPTSIDRVQASMLRINPITAWHLLNRQTPLNPGDWVAQNAANSGVGRALIQIARKQGLRTLNFVRRAELIPELLALGADAVFLDTDAGVAEAKALLGPAPLKLASNAVGGDSAIHLMELLSPEGLMVTYGAMSRRSLKVPNKYLIFKNLRLHGLWITQWFEKAIRTELDEVFQTLANMVLSGELITAVDTLLPMQDHPQAMRRAQEASRQGKVILDLA
jgi:mitochondrial enoyl-[acyl-carrier protein] reductase / trans-2-enoyl-CoA reductase